MKVKNKNFCCLVGPGYWGEKIKKIIQKKFERIIIVKNKKDLNQVDTKHIKWAFISSPENTHYYYLKYFIKKKIKVFCEKPLTNNLGKAREIIKLSKKYKSKLYIDDIEKYKKKNFKIFNKNKILRCKNFKYSPNKVFEKLFYHDVYIVEKYLKKSVKIKSINIKSDNVTIEINSKKKFIFDYFLKSKKNIHTINNINRISKVNNLKKMLYRVLSEKVDFQLNNESALFCEKILNKIYKFKN